MIYDRCSFEEVQEKLEASQGAVAQELRKELGRAEERLRELRQAQRAFLGFEAMLFHRFSLRFSSIFFDVLTVSVVFWCFRWCFVCW